MTLHPSPYYDAHFIRFFLNSWSAKYMAPDNVLEYINHQGLFPPALTPSSSTTAIIAPMPVHAIAANVVSAK
jgi:hypothetical protein